MNWYSWSAISASHPYEGTVLGKGSVFAADANSAAKKARSALQAQRSWLPARVFLRLDLERGDKSWGVNLLETYSGWDIVSVRELSGLGDYASRQRGSFPAAKEHSMKKCGFFCKIGQFFKGKGLSGLGGIVKFTAFDASGKKMGSGEMQGAKVDDATTAVYFIQRGGRLPSNFTVELTDGVVTRKFRVKATSGGAFSVERDYVHDYSPDLGSGPKVYRVPFLVTDEKGKPYTLHQLPRSWGTNPPLYKSEKAKGGYVVAWKRPDGGFITSVVRHPEGTSTFAIDIENLAIQGAVTFTSKKAAEAAMRRAPEPHF